MKQERPTSVLQSPLFRAFLVLAVLGAFACTVQEFDAKETYKCTTDSDCISGYVCHDALNDGNSVCTDETTIQKCFDVDGDGASAGDCIGIAIEDLDCDDNDGSNYPGNTELCDGKDNNCNDMTDEGVAPVACPLNANGVCAVSAPTIACVNGEQREAVCLDGCDALGSMTCQYGDQFVTDESLDTGTCDDGVDNDCDGLTDADDDNCPECMDGATCEGSGCIGLVGQSADNCACFGTGTRRCDLDPSGEKCYDGDGNEIPGPFDTPTDTPGNMIDDDCDGEIDED